MSDQHGSPPCAQREHADGRVGRREDKERGTYSKHDVALDFESAGHEQFLGIGFSLGLFLGSCGACMCGRIGRRGKSGSGEERRGNGQFMASCQRFSL